MTERAGAFESYTQDASKAGTLKQTDFKGAQIVCMEKANCLNPWDCQSKRIFTTNGPYPTLPAMAGGGANNQAICFQASGDRDNPSISTSEKAYCIPANPMSDRGQAVCYPIDSHQQDSRFKVCADGISPTLPGQMGTGGNNGPMVLETTKPPRKYIIRRLTPLECARLQGFPDWWEAGVQGSDSARYKMWGNGIALPNAEYVIGCAKELIEGKLPEVEG